MRKALIAAGVALALTGAAYGYARFRASQLMEAGLAAFADGLPAGSVFSYDSAEPRLWRRSAHLTGLRLTIGRANYTAAEADIAPDGPTGLRHLVLRDAAEITADTTTAAALVEADGASIPGELLAIDPKTVRMDHLALRDIRFVAVDGITMTVGTLTLDGYGAGRPAVLDMQAISVSSPGQRVDRLDAAHLRVAGLDLSRYVPPADPGLETAGADPAAQASGLAILAAGKPFITVASVVAAPTRLAVTDFVVLADDQLTPGLRQAGFARFQATLLVDATLDRAARRLALQQVDLRALDMGHAHLEAAFDNLPPDLLGPSIGAAQLGRAGLELAGLQLRRLAFSYEDQSLVAKLFAAGAAQRALTTAQLVAGAQDQVRTAAAQYGVPEAAVTPVLAFLADPHWLSVTLAPPQPVPVIGLPSLLRGDPATALGLRVTNQPAPQ